MAPAQKTEMETVKAAIDAWITSVEGKDIELLPKVVAHDPDLVWIGTDAGDWIGGYEALEKVMQAQNAALEEIHITVSDETIHIAPNERFAWATNRWIFKATMGDQEIELPLRCTWIVEKREAGWVLVHFHKSVGVAG